MTHSQSKSHEVDIHTWCSSRKKVIYGELRRDLGEVANFVSTVGRDEQAIRTHIREGAGRTSASTTPVGSQ